MIQSSTNLRPFNTFGISVNAKRFARFSNLNELRACLDEQQNDPILFLGGGSNVLFTTDFDGLVLRNELKGIELIEQDDSHVWIRAGAGEVWHDLVLFCVNNNYGGVENLSLIPGSVGASPMQNIGAYGVEIKDIFSSLEAMNLSTREVETFDKKACEFGYRESVFKRALKGQYVITSVTFKLTKNHAINSSYGAIGSELEKMGVDHPTIVDISHAVIAIRSSKLPNPAEIGNAGSFFKNPVVEQSVLEKIQANFEQVPNYPAGDGCVKLAAGWLIEQAGWKGKSFGNYGVHKLQALVLVNYLDATGEEIFDLSSQIIADIEGKFGVTLEREVNVL